MKNNPFFPLVASGIEFACQIIDDRGSRSPVIGIDFDKWPEVIAPQLEDPAFDRSPADRPVDDESPCYALFSFWCSRRCLLSLMIRCITLPRGFRFIVCVLRMILLFRPVMLLLSL